jgi:hypothetical protein
MLEYTQIFLCRMDMRYIRHLGQTDGSNRHPDAQTTLFVIIWQE